VSRRLRDGLSYPAYCNAFFGTHGCDLSAGHPPELGHICLASDNERFPDQVWSRHHTEDVTYSEICYRAEADDPDVWTGDPATYAFAAPGPRPCPCHPDYREREQP
jgi:hypothetical protein